jgi:hypothetical protein
MLPYIRSQWASIASGSAPISSGVSTSRTTAAVARGPIGACPSPQPTVPSSAVTLTRQVWAWGG